MRQNVGNNGGGETRNNTRGLLSTIYSQSEKHVVNTQSILSYVIFTKDYEYRIDQFLF